MTGEIEDSALRLLGLSMPRDCGVFFRQLGCSVKLKG